MRMRAAGAVVALAALTASGCGGGGKSGGLSQDEYVKKADAICEQVVKQQKALPTPTSISEIPAYVDKALPIIDQAVGEIRSMKPPATMEKGVKAWLDKTDATRAQLVRLRDAAKAGDANATKVREIAAKGTKLDGDRSSLARSIGLTTCANT